MSSALEIEAVAADLPPPLVLDQPEATKLNFLLQSGHPPCCVAQIVAARGGEGTSTIARDLAITAAASGIVTLLLAAEPPGRRTDWPRDVYGFGSNLLAVESPEALQMARLGRSKLVVAASVGGTSIPVNAWAAYLVQLRTAFDYILIDAPAVERDFTAVMLSPHVDANAIVVEAESTPSSVVRTVRDRLTAAGGSVAGVILNRRRFHLPRAIADRL